MNAVLTTAPISRNSMEALPLLPAYSAYEHLRNLQIILDNIPQAHDIQGLMLDRARRTVRAVLAYGDRTAEIHHCADRLKQAAASFDTGRLLPSQQDAIKTISIVAADLEEMVMPEPVFEESEECDE